MISGLEFAMRMTAAKESMTLDHSVEQFAERKPQAFLLRLQESVTTRQGASHAIEMGTSTFTEVRQEAADADPRSHSYFAIHRET